jgi:hypothetical protein
MFTCSGDKSFNLDVPLDDNGQITLYAFCSGFEPIKKVFYPSEGHNMNLPVTRSDSDQDMNVYYDILPYNRSKVRMIGNIYFNNSPVCAMALANGQYMFSSPVNGSFMLDLPLDDKGGITFHGFCSGLPPYKETIPSYSIDMYEDNDGDGTTIAGGDCNDLDASIYLGATEICGDGIDQDCDGSDSNCGTPPTITDVKLYKIVNGSEIESYVFNAGDQAIFKVWSYDPDKDVEFAYFDQFYPFDSNVRYSDPYTLYLPTQANENNFFYPLEYLDVNPPYGKWRLEFYMVDANDNQSNRWTIYIVIN